jgi:hypothetical protein
MVFTREARQSVINECHNYMIKMLIAYLCPYVYWKTEMLLEVLWHCP